MKALSRLAAAACTLVLLCHTMQCAHAYSAQLFGSAKCPPADVMAYSTKLENGGCIDINQISAKTVCSGGTATAALYVGNGCQVLAARGSGVGDGVTCISLPSVDRTGTFSAHIDCSAPGPDPALSSGAKMGIIAGSVAGGVLLLGCLVWCCYRSHKRNAAVLHSHSIHMGASQLQYVPPDAYAQQHRGGPNTGRLAQLAQPLSGSMMALVSCIALIQAVASMEGVAAAAPASTSASKFESFQFADFYNFGDNCPGAWWKAAPSVWLYFAAPILLLLDQTKTPGAAIPSGVAAIGIFYCVLAAAFFVVCVCLCGCGKACSVFQYLFIGICVGVLVLALSMWPSFAYAAWLQRNYPAWCYGFISFNVSNIICSLTPLAGIVGMLYFGSLCKDAQRNLKRH